MQKPETLSVPPSVQMSELLDQPHICKGVARLFPELQRILLQTQLDIVNPENRDTVGPTLLGLKHIHDILLLFKRKGDLLIKQEPNE